LLIVFTFTIPGTVGYFQSIGYPGVVDYLVIAGEIGGGLALLLGVWTRAISLLLLPIMIGAILQHIGGGWLFTNQGGGWEFPVFWTAALIVQALLGDGAFALGLSRNSNPVGKLANA
jgi:putative oxidoreductase